MGGFCSGGPCARRFPLVGAMPASPFRRTQGAMPRNRVTASTFLGCTSCVNLLTFKLGGMTEWQGAGLENRYARKGFGVRIPVPPYDAPVAQGTERRTADAKAGGSSPPGRKASVHQSSRRGLSPPISFCRERVPTPPLLPPCPPVFFAAHRVRHYATFLGSSLFHVGNLSGSLPAMR